ncbi:40S ribosomal protein S30 [Fasciola gigantica]|uniref:40S ribosomal protein S30 n=1 Tax=Fasciola gigantica TaxID=46835 RepID=A0A504YF33_FASGI|nr:40S ribosomal protein S30 [Fasciola gigantica]
MLFVKSFDIHVVDTDSCRTGADLKVFLANKDNLPLDGLQLYSGPSVLGDLDLLGELSPGNCVDVVVPILGGKVHGSLARAGKVRAQTPKVEKQEKKKKPRGRAKRRMQYNKRFVAVVQQVGGRRRGPNANVKA